MIALRVLIQLCELMTCKVLWVEVELSTNLS